MNGVRNRSRGKAGFVVASLALVALAVVGGVDAKGGGGGGGGGGGNDTKQGALIPASCTGGAFGWFGYNKSGDRVTLGTGATSDTTGGTWTLTVIDNFLETPVYAGSNGTVGNDWTVITNFTAPKGINFVSIHMRSDATGDVCDATVTFKV